MELCKRSILLDPNPCLFKVEPNGTLLIMTLHMNTFAGNVKWECQPRCNICHHFAFDLAFHIFFILGDSQDSDAIT